MKPGLSNIIYVCKEIHSDYSMLSEEVTGFLVQQDNEIQLERWSYMETIPVAGFYILSLHLGAKCITMTFMVNK